MSKDVTKTPKGLAPTGHQRRTPHLSSSKV